MANAAPPIQVFRPTLKEMNNFSKYIEYLESEGAHYAGLAKIIPPRNWRPRKGNYDNINIDIPSPITQQFCGKEGVYQLCNIEGKTMSMQTFKSLAQSHSHLTPKHNNYEDLERNYWRNISFNCPVYGADVSGSLFDPDVKEFNIQHLNTILDKIKNDYEIKIEGVNTAYLYFGMWKSSFAWHTEDMELYSINYLHFGAPKSWYVVPPNHGKRLERLAAQFFHKSSATCPAFLRHKMSIISPNILKNFSIPFRKITQESGEFMIAFPFAYHAGFNHGFNCAESTNFALPRWIQYAKNSIPCKCRNDSVYINMKIILKLEKENLEEELKKERELTNINKSKVKKEGGLPKNIKKKKYERNSTFKIEKSVSAEEDTIMEELDAKFETERNIYNEIRCRKAVVLVEKLRLNPEEQQNLKTIENTY